MSNYWLMLVVCGAMGCSASPVEAPGANQEAVSDGDTGQDVAGASEGEKGDGDKDTKPSNTCDEERAKLVEALATAKDLALIASLKQEYMELEKRCPAGPDPTADDCKLQLAEAEKDLAVAIESGDGKAIADAKEKYARAEKECHPPDVDPCKEPGSKPGDAKPGDEKPGNDGGAKPDAKPDDKPGNDGGAKPDAKPDDKPGNDGGAKPDAKPGNDGGAKPDAKPGDGPKDDGAKGKGDDSNDNPCKKPGKGESSAPPEGGPGKGEAEPPVK
jgi:hypothetical protein